MVDWDQSKRRLLRNHQLPILKLRDNLSVALPLEKMPPPDTDQVAVDPMVGEVGLDGEHVRIPRHHDRKQAFITVQLTPFESDPQQVLIDRRHIIEEILPSPHVVAPHRVVPLNDALRVCLFPSIVPQERVSTVTVVECPGGLGHCVHVLDVVGRPGQEVDLRTTNDVSVEPHQRIRTEDVVFAGVLEDLEFGHADHEVVIDSELRQFFQVLPQLLVPSVDLLDLVHVTYVPFLLEPIQTLLHKHRINRTPPLLDKLFQLRVAVNDQFGGGFEHLGELLELLFPLGSTDCLMAYVVERSHVGDLQSPAEAEDDLEGDCNEKEEDARGHCWDDWIII